MKSEIEIRLQLNVWEAQLWHFYLHFLSAYYYFFLIKVYEVSKAEENSGISTLFFWEPLVYPYGK